MELKDKKILFVGHRGKVRHLSSAREQGAKLYLLTDQRDYKSEFDNDFEQVYKVDDVFDWQQIELALKGATFDAALTRFEDYTTVVAAIADHFKLPGVDFVNAPKFRNKYLMRQAFVEHNVPSADFALVQSVADADDLIERVGFPLIVKQISGIHSKYVSKVHSRDELEHKINYFLGCLAHETGTLHGQLINYPKQVEAPDHFTHLLVEEFTKGEELTVDAFVVAGQVHLTPICKYVMSEELGFADHHLPIRIMPHDLTEVEQEIVNNAVKAALKSLGANYCVTHAEVFFDRITADCRLIEVASRGGGYRAEMVEHTCSGNYDLGVVRAALGLDPLIANQPTSYAAVAEVFAPLNGTLQAIDFSILEDQSDVHHLTINRQVGQSVGRALDGRSFILKFLVSGDSYNAADARARDLLMAVRQTIQIEGDSE